MQLDWSKNRYRVFAYLLASVSAYAIFLWSGYGYLLWYIDYVGMLLLFLFYGRPHMYAGWFPSNSVLPLVLTVLGLFVEIFVVCEVARKAFRAHTQKVD